MRKITKLLLALLALLTLINCTSDDDNSENEENLNNTSQKITYQSQVDKKQELVFEDFETINGDPFFTKKAKVKYYYDGRLLTKGKSNIGKDGMNFTFELNCHLDDNYLFRGCFITADYSKNFITIRSIFREERHFFVNKDYVPPTD